MSNTPQAKTYHSRVPGSSFWDKKGICHIFIGGKLTTSDPELQAELDPLVANGKNPLLYSPVGVTAIPAVANEMSEIADRLKDNAATATQLDNTTAGALATAGAAPAGQPAQTLNPVSTAGAGGNAAPSNSK